MKILLITIIIAITIKISYAIKKSNLKDEDCFLLGVGLYAIFPFAAFYILNSNDPLYVTWRDNFIYAANYTKYFLSIILIFACSYFIGKKIPSLNLNIFFNSNPNITVLLAVTSLFVIYFVVSLINARGILGQGYLVDYNPTLIGPLATSSLAFLLISLYSLDWNLKSLFKITLFFLILNSFALLLVGSRIYVLIPLVAFIIYFVNSSSFSKYQIFTFSSIIVCVLAVTGVWRLGTAITLDQVIVKASAEFLLTAVTVSWYVECVDASIIENPFNLFYSFINFIPSFILPDKTQIIANLRDFEDCYHTPFGALSVYVSLLETFGYIGAVLAIILFSYLMKCIKGNCKKGYWLYYYLCALIPFSLFRDNFDIFAKIFVLQGFLFALMLSLLCKYSKLLKSNS